MRALFLRVLFITLFLITDSFAYKIYLYDWQTFANIKSLIDKDPSQFFKLSYLILKNRPDVPFKDELLMLDYYECKRENYKDCYKAFFSSINEDNLPPYYEKYYYVQKYLHTKNKSIALKYSQFIYPYINKQDFSKEELTSIGISLGKMGLYDKALEFIEPSNIYYPYFKGFLLIKENKIEEAFSLLNNIKKTFLYSKAYKEYSNFAIKKLFYENNEKKIISLKDIFYNDFDKFFYLGLSYYQLKDYENALKSFTKDFLYKKSPRALYWLYKTYLKLGKKEEATNVLKNLSYSSSYYGNKAKLILGEKLKTKGFNICDKQEPKESYDSKMFVDISKLGFYYYARKLYEKHIFSLGELCYIYKYNPDFVLIQTKEYDSFIRPFKSIVNSVSKELGVDKDLIYSIMRKESSYNPYATAFYYFPNKSPTVGLMQVKESTALYLYKKFGIVGGLNMYSPKDSIYSGTLYLKFLETLFDNNIVKVIAAYNMGQNAILKYKNFEDEDLFIEHLPNRYYVEKVLDYLWHYKYLN